MRRSTANSDYITEVTSKDQIVLMQEDYNRRVNRFLDEQLGDRAPPVQQTWHNTLDVDFMADPDLIRDPAEFRAIAELNNDAYRSRFAAQYERISRQSGGGVIGPEHVNGYMSEMDRFAGKKRRSIESMLAEPASYFNEPANRAELFRTMAQEQKYTSRLEALDDFLRAQEGLPPRNRGITAAKLGSNRSPDNAANIRAGSALVGAGRADALEELAETMAQISAKNPGFDRHSADSIAAVIEKLPPNRRAAALARIGASGRPGLIQNVVDASRRAGRLPRGASLADDLARAGGKLDDAAEISAELDAFRRAGGGRRAVRSAIDLLDAIGRAAERVEMAVVTGELAGLLAELDDALDPSKPPHEAQAMLADIKTRADRLRNSAILAALIERYPPIAAIFLGLFVGCVTGEIVSPSRAAGELGAGTSETGSCLDRHVTAMQRFSDWLTGESTTREANRDRLCEKFRIAVAEGRALMKDDWTVEEACQWIRFGNPIDHMFERVGPRANTAAAAADDEPEPQIGPESAAEDVGAEVERLLAAVRATLADGESARREVAAHCARLADAGNDPSDAGAGAALLGEIGEALERAGSQRAAVTAAVRVAEGLRFAVARSMQRADEGSAEACRLAERDDANLPAVEAAAKTARNHAVLAAQVAREAISKAEAALTKPDLPHPADLAMRIAANSPEKAPVCQVVSNLPSDVFVVDRATMAANAATGQLAPIFGLLKHPNMRGKVDATLQYAALQQRATALRDGVADHEACAAAYLAAAQACSANGRSGGLGDVRTQLVAYTATYQETQTVVEAQSAMLRSAADEMGRTADEAQSFAERAALCVRQARTQTQDRSNTLDELAELADLSSLSCSVEDIDARVATLGSDEFGTSGEAVSLSRELTALAGRLVLLQSQLDKINSLIRNARAQDDLDGVPGRISSTRKTLGRMPDAIDCARFADALSEASRMLRQRQEELEETVENLAQANDRCTRQYGKSFVKVVGSKGAYSCRYCKNGYEATAGGCRAPQKVADAWCNANNRGSGWVATNFTDKGGYSCRLTQAAANRFCNRRNSGSGWMAIRQRDGTYKCRLPQKTARRRAVDDCKRQARAAGKVYAMTQVNRDGSYRCRWCERGFYYKGGRCHARQQQVRQRAPRPRRNGRCRLPPPPCHVSMDSNAMAAERQCRANRARAMQQYNACKARGR